MNGAERKNKAAPAVGSSDLLGGVDFCINSQPESPPIIIGHVNDARITPTVLRQCSASESPVKLNSHVVPAEPSQDYAKYPNIVEPDNLGALSISETWPNEEYAKAVAKLTVK